MTKFDLSTAQPFIEKAAEYANEYLENPKKYDSKVAAGREIQKAINVIENFKKDLRTLYHDREQEKKSKKPVEAPAEGTPAE